MEIYLSHMVIYRVVEKIGLNTMMGDGWFQYIVTVVVVLVGAAMFAVVMQRIFGMLEKQFI